MDVRKLAYFSIVFATIFVANGALAATKTINYARPISFEPNRGQTDKQVDFVAHGTGYRLFLSHAEAVMVLNGSTVRMKPIGSSRSATATALDPQASHSNYFIGNAPERWHTDIPNYAKARYGNVYPGVDLIYYGNQRQLEYDFVVKPRADPGSIGLQFEGPGELAVDPSGDVVMHTAAGDLRWHKPVAYQEISGNRKLVQCAYMRNGANRLRFALGTYDRTIPLIIDPVLVYSTYLGGSNSDFANAIAVDANGNAYVTGVATSDDFPTTNAFQNKLNGFPPNAFVTKFDAAGKLVYSTYLGGGRSAEFTGTGDHGSAIAVDNAGHAYITGTTDSEDFPTKNAFQMVKPGKYQNAFVTKLASTGDALIYSTYLGGSTGGIDFPNDQGNGIAVDVHGNAYITGPTTNRDFPTKDPVQAQLNGPQNAFVTKLCPAGNALVYSTFLGGSVWDQGNGIAVDTRGNAYVTGGTASLDFPIKDAFQDHNNGNQACLIQGLTACNGFVTKFTAAGNALVYSTYVGGSGVFEDQNAGIAFGDSARSIAVDSQKHVFVTGVTYSTDFPIKNAFQNNLGSPAGNAFITEFDEAGTALVYSTYLGGSGNPSPPVPLGDAGTSIAIDSRGDAYVTGFTSSTDFPIKNAFLQHRANQYGNAFVSELDAAGTALVYSSYLGGSDGGFCDAGECYPSDFGFGVAVDRRGNAYVTGETTATNFPTNNAFQPENVGFRNAFVTKVSSHCYGKHPR